MNVTSQRALGPQSTASVKAYCFLSVPNMGTAHLKIISLALNDNNDCAGELAMKISTEQLQPYAATIVEHLVPILGSSCWCHAPLHPRKQVSPHSACRSGRGDVKRIFATPASVGCLMLWPACSAMYHSWWASASDLLLHITCWPGECFQELLACILSIQKNCVFLSMR